MGRSPVVRGNSTVFASFSIRVYYEQKSTPSCRSALSIITSRFEITTVKQINYLFLSCDSELRDIARQLASPFINGNQTSQKRMILETIYMHALCRRHAVSNRAR